MPVVDSGGAASGSEAVPLLPYRPARGGRSGTPTSLLRGSVGMPLRARRVRSLRRRCARHDGPSFLFDDSLTCYEREVGEICGEARGRRMSCWARTAPRNHRVRGAGRRGCVASGLQGARLHRIGPDWPAFEEAALERDELVVLHRCSVNDWPIAVILGDECKSRPVVGRPIRHEVGHEVLRTLLKSLRSSAWR
jgi:hypothetical protein